MAGPEWMHDPLRPLTVTARKETIEVKSMDGVMVVLAIHGLT